MKKYLIIFSLLSITSINANENLEIEKDKLFENSLEAKTMKASFSLKGKNKHDTILEHSVAKVIDIAKKANCTGGQYRVRPNYIYDKNIQIMDGYSTQVSFQCTFKNKEIYGSVLDEMKKIDTLTLSQGEISYFLSKEIIEKEIENLELDALKYGISYTKSLNKNLDQYRSCMISKVSFKKDNRYNAPTISTMRVLKSEATNNTEVSNPISNKQTVSLQAYYTFKCTRK